MSNAKKKLKIFISSPGDVGQERLISARVFERLQGAFSNVFDLDVILWEHEPLRATGHYQEELIPPSECDLMIMILWSRLGTRLPERFKKEDGSDYDSGTEWEFEDALKGFKATGVPEIMVYRKTQVPVHAIHDEEALMDRLKQKKALDKFTESWFGSADTGFDNAYHCFETPDEFEEKLEMHIKRYLTERMPEHITEGGMTAAVTWTEGSPFRGLEPFDLNHAPVFFGRTREISEIREALMRRAEMNKPFVMILGMSGGGKSSLARAGVLATMIQPGIIEGVGMWRYAMMRPTDAQNGDLHSALVHAFLEEPGVPELTSQGLSVDELVKLTRESPSGFFSTLKMALVKIAKDVQKTEELSKPPVTKFALLIDQFEEIFTNESLDQDEIKSFIHLISELVDSGVVWVIATMRSDFYHRATDYPELVDLKEGEGQYHLMAPDFGEIGQMIRQPARAAGLQFELHPETNIPLDEVIQEAAAKSPENLPLLEFVLEELFQRRSEEGVLTYKAYDELGGLEGALAERAEEVFKSLPEASKAELDTILRALITLQKGDTLKPLATRISYETFTSSEPRKAFIDAFVEARLLISDQHESGVAVIRIAHEALILHWPRVTNWLQNDVEFLRVRARVTEAERQWTNEGESTDFLLAEGKPIADAAELLKRREALDVQLVKFIEVSQARIDAKALAKEKEAKRKLSLFRGLSFLFALLSLGAVVGSYIGYRGQKIAVASKRTAEEEAQKAKKSQFKAEKSESEALVENKKGEIATHAAQIAKLQAQLQFSIGLQNQSNFLANLSESETEEGRVEMGILLALEALPKESDARLRPYVVEAEASLYKALYNYRSKEDFDGLRQKITTIAFSPDLTRVAASTIGGAIRIWAVAKPEESSVEIKAHQGRISHIVFSPDGKYLASAGFDNKANLWSVTTGKKIRSFEGHQAPLTTIRFAESGRKLLTAGRDEMIHAWDVNTGKHLRTFEGHSDWVTGLEVSQKLPVFWSVSLDKTLRVWSWETGQTELVYTYTAPLFELALAGSEKYVAAAGQDGAVLLYTLHDKSMTVLESHYGSVTHLDFSGDSKFLASSSRDKTARLWDVKARKLIRILGGHDDRVTHLSFDEKNSLLVTGSDDGTFRVWDAATGLQTMILDAAKPVTAVELLPHGKGLFVARGRGRLDHWKLTKIGGKISLPHKERVISYAYHPKGQGMMTAGGDNIVRFWDVKKGKEEFQLPARDAKITEVLYSPSGQYYAFGLASGDIEIWEEGGSQPNFVLQGHKLKVTSMVFSPDDRTLVSGAQDNTIRVWDIQTGKEKTQFVGHKSSILKLKLSQDGMFVYSAAQDGEAKQWSMETKELVQNFKGHEGPIYDLAISDDAQKMITGGQDRTARIWDLQTGRTSLILRGHRDVVRHVDILENGKLVLTASADHALAIWNSITGRQNVRIEKHTGSIEQAFFNRQGTRVFTSSSDGSARSFDVNSGSEITLLHEGITPVVDAKLRPGGEQIALSLASGQIMLVPVFSSTEDVIAYARSLVKKELSPLDRQRYFLGGF